jgi:hypothetical protein
MAKRKKTKRKKTVKKWKSKKAVRSVSVIPAFAFADEGSSRKKRL